MARPRKTKTSGLPTGVYFGKNRWFIRHADGTETKLAPAGATKKQIWDAFLAVPQAPKKAGDQLTLRAMAQLYRAGLYFQKLSPRTRKDAELAFGKLLSFDTEDGGTFGDCIADDVTPGVIRLYLDHRGAQSPTRANREVAYLSMAFSWALERELVTANPCLGVRRNEETARTRYVNDIEYAQRYALAGELGRIDVQVMMELTYLCRLRENEVLKMMDTDTFITAEGLIARRGKGSKTQIINWSPRLLKAIELARSVPRQIASPMLVVSPFTGRPLVLAAFKSAWQQVKLKAADRGHAIDWTFHDLKAKGVSDFEGDKHLASGHKTHAMTEVYNRKLDQVKSTR